MAAESDFPTTGYLVWRLSTRFRAAADRALAPLGLTHAQYALLASLYGLSREGARPSQRELSDFSGLEPMYVSKLARALERAGLVARPQNRADPRAFSLTLTERGEDLATRAIAVIVALQDELTAPIGGPRSARNRELTATLQTLLNAEEDMPQTPPLTGQDIGEAAAAIRVLLDELAVGQTSAQVYGGLDRDDLATTRRVLHAVRERALAMAAAGRD